jgi:hypothetical protein
MNVLRFVVFVVIVDHVSTGFVSVTQLYFSTICDISRSYGERHTNIHISSSSRSMPIKSLTESQNSSYVGVETYTNISVKKLCYNFWCFFLPYSKCNHEVTGPEGSTQQLHRILM